MFKYRIQISILIANSLFIYFTPFCIAEKMDEKAINAYQIFSENWKIFEKKRHQEFSQKMLERKKNLEISGSKEESENKKVQIEQLKKAIDIYRKHESLNSNDKTLYFNLALALTQLGDLQSGLSQQLAQQSYLEALKVAEKSFEDLSNQTHSNLTTQTLYLLALLQDKLNRTEEASSTLKRVIQNEHSEPLTIFAFMTLGDIYYNNKRFEDAMTTYREADQKAHLITHHDVRTIKPKLLYRLSWASFRAGNNDLTIDTAIRLYKEYSWGQGVLDVNSVKEDAVILLSESLHAKNSNHTIYSFVSKNIPISGTVIGRLLSRQAANGLHEQVVVNGENFLKFTPLSKETPIIFEILANSFHVLGQPDKSREYLENLSLMLPPKSLWRTQFQSDLDQMKRMEKIAEAATLKLATSYYSNGLISGNPKSFLKAESAYKRLLNSMPTDPRVSEWKLKVAHSNFFAKKYDQAYSKYKKTIQETELSPEQLRLAIYQSVIASENAWRILFNKITQSGQNPKQSMELTQLNDRLEESINHYVERFPGESRSIDLLLVGASVFRDIDNLEKAQNLWQRALVLNANSSQRSLAIRGILYSKIKIATPREVIDTAFNFIKLENWQTMDRSLYSEINSVLSTSLFNEAERLRAEGSIAEAAKLIAEISSAVPDIPERERLMRDSAYMFGIAGLWLQAERAASRYLESGFPQFQADMQYLYARSTEYQLKIQDAANAYYILAKNHGNHAKASLAMERAKALAEAEGLDNLLLAIAALKLNRSKLNRDKVQSLDKMIEVLVTQEKYNEAEKNARLRLRLSTNAYEKYQSRILLAKISYLSGSKQEGLDEFRILDKQITDQKSKLSNTQFQDLIGQVNMLRANHFKSLFNSVNLSSSGDTQRSINQKASYFSQCTQLFEKVIRFGNPEKAAEARYEIGQAADALANEIASISIRSDSTAKLIAQSRNKETILRLEKLAQSQYAQNVLSSKKGSDHLANNEWVKKSLSRLNSNQDHTSHGDFSEVSPIASYGGLISQWNTATAQ